jgi:peptide/nickel transport system permease protein
MRAYLIRRLLLIIPTLFILSILVFLSVRFIPGDAIDVMVGMLVSEEYLGGAWEIDREALERMLGLDVPVYVQYGRWIGVLPTPDWVTGESRYNGLLHGTLGESLLGDWTVEEKIIGRLPVTIELGVLAIVIGLVIALPVGIYSAIRQDTATDYLGRSIAIIGLATPNFWLAIMVMIYPAIWWGWAPPMRWVPFTEDLLGNLGILIIPSVILGTAMSAATMRMTRTMMLEVLRQDYIRTAWSKGLKERVVIMRHAVKNALIPVVTLIGLQLPILVGGAVIMENIFNLPGLGRLMVDALESRDYPVVSAINLIFATAVLVINLIIDLFYAFLDPRVRYE